jgi:hypothetical protein
MEVSSFSANLVNTSSKLGVCPVTTSLNTSSKSRVSSNITSLNTSSKLRDLVSVVWVSIWGMDGLAKITVSSVIKLFSNISSMSNKSSWVSSFSKTGVSSRIASSNISSIE